MEVKITSISLLSSLKAKCISSYADYPKESLKLPGMFQILPNHKPSTFNITKQFIYITTPESKTITLFADKAFIIVKKNYISITGNYIFESKQKNMIPKKIIDEMNTASKKQTQST